MDIEVIKAIVYILIAIAGFLFTSLIPSVVLLIKKWKEAKNAKTESEKLAIYTDMYTEVKQIISDTEEAYKNVDAIMKQSTGKGDSKGKKYAAMEAVRIACLEKGVEFDSKYWSEFIDKEVDFSKSVNKNSTSEDTECSAEEAAAKDNISII